MEISIIIVNFNVKYFLEQCLYSVMKASKNIEAEIFVVDNNSTDGSSIFFKNRFAEVKFIWNKENTGFSKANNLASKLAAGKFILFLNPDTILAEDSLEKCLSFFKLDNEVGAMGIKMIDGNGKYLKESKRAFPSPATSFFKLAGLSALFPSSKIFSRYYLGHLDPYQNQEVDVLAGAFLLIKKSVLDITGGFDERFFMYGEDIDLSYRIQKAGFKNIYFAESTILHFKGESTNRGSTTFIRQFYGAMRLFVNKHYNSGFAIFYTLIIQVAIWMGVILSGVEHLWSLLLNKRIKIPTVKNCLILAEKTEFDYIKALLDKNFNQPKVMGRVSPNNLIESDTLGNLDTLSKLIDTRNIKEIIFCLNNLRVKEAIDLVQELSGGLNFRFHFEGSVSIVGSKNKEAAGECIA